MVDHERIEELIAARSLRGLDPDGQRELAAAQAEHDPDCPDCARMERDYEEVAGRLAFALDPAAVRPGLEEELVERAAGPRRGERRTGWPRRAVLALAAAVVLLAGGVAGYLAAPRGQTANVAALGSLLAEPGSRLVQFRSSGSGAGSRSGGLALAYHPGRRAAFVVGTGLSSAPEGKVYELWLMRGGVPPTPSGTFTGGADVLILPLHSGVGRARALAVTVEKAPGANRPTTTPVWTASVRA